MAQAAIPGWDNGRTLASSEETFEAFPPVMLNCEKFQVPSQGTANYSELRTVWVADGVWPMVG